MAVKDPYEVLGVQRSATADEIKSAYRRLARRYHPDVNQDDPTAEDKFKEIGAAYSVLSDPEKRARFDQFGTTEDGPQAGDFFNNGGGFGDLFDMFFGGVAGQGGGRRRMGRDGDDLRADVEIELKDVLAGKKVDIEIDRDVECDSCAGKGTEGGTTPETCGTCKGQGVVSTVRSTFIGQVRTQAVCPTCQGEGTLIKNPCKKCNGKRVVEESGTVTVNIPAGVESGSTMQLPGHGNEGTGGGRTGDLYVVIGVKPDSRFERRGQTLFTTLQATFAQAALGDHVEIEGVDGDVSVEVKAGTQPGTPFTVKGAGLPPLHGGRRGDLIVQINVVVPTKVNDAEAKLIRELADLRGERQPQGEGKGGFLGGLFGKK